MIRLNEKQRSCFTTGNNRGFNGNLEPWSIRRSHHKRRRISIQCQRIWFLLYVSQVAKTNFSFSVSFHTVVKYWRKLLQISGVTTSEESIFTYVGLADWYSFVEGSEWQPVLEPTFPEGITDLTEDDVSVSFILLLLIYATNIIIK